MTLKDSNDKSQDKVELEPDESKNRINNAPIENSDINVAPKSAKESVVAASVPSPKKMPKTKAPEDSQPSASTSSSASVSASVPAPDILLSFRNVKIDYEVREGLVKSVDGISFDVERGKVTALIGESGSGKSTLTGAILRILAPNGKISPDSSIIFEGKDILKMLESEIRNFRWRKASMVFQAAQNAMNPTIRIKQQIMDTVIDHGENPNSETYTNRLSELLGMVRLPPSRVLNSFPHELSGGMRQRVIIAMSMILNPEFIILDEPTTALDVITQYYIFEILDEIHAKTNLTMLFITHDMSAVAKLADNIGVMYAGKIFEMAEADIIFDYPLHPYTIGLMGSIPSIEGDDIKREPIPGQTPDLIDKPPGCVFHPRCEYAKEICKEKEPEFLDMGKRHFVACHFARKLERSNN